MTVKVLFTCEKKVDYSRLKLFNSCFWWIVGIFLYLCEQIEPIMNPIKQNHNE